jgi:uncharacterized membrane protein YidH (DUF202 family)
MSRETIGGENARATTPEVASCPSSSRADDDRGMAKERTCLAWHRTGLSLLALSMAVLRAVTVGRTPFIVVGTMIGLGVLTTAWALPGATRRATGRSVQPMARLSALRRVAICIEAMALVTAVLAVFPSAR